MNNLVTTCALRALAAVSTKSIGPPKPAVPTLSLGWGATPHCLGVIKNQLVKRTQGNEDRDIMVKNTMLI